MNDSVSSEFVLDTSRKYAIYTAQNRGIPDIPDGLIDPARKALWILWGKPHNELVKVTALSGAMVESGLYLHGDASGTIANLAKEFGNNVPLLGKQGAFGTFTEPNGKVAGRYVYVKRVDITKALVYTDIDLVPMVEKLDGTMPAHFLPPIPLLLLNGHIGIAYGWSTDILPYRFDDLVNATIKAIEGKDFQRLSPEYTSLGEQRGTFVEHNDKGDTVWEFTGDCEIVDTSTIRVTALPPMFPLEDFIESLNFLIEGPDPRSKEYKDNPAKLAAATRRWEREREKSPVTDHKDVSEDRIDVLITFKRGSLKGWTKEDAIDRLKLRSRKTERLIAVGWDGERMRWYRHGRLHDGTPDPSLGPPTTQYIKEWVEWRFGWYKVRYEKKLAEDRHELLYWKMVEACFRAGFAASLSKEKDKAGVVRLVMDCCALSPLMKKDTPDPGHADRIASLPGYRWAKDGHEEVKAKIAEHEASIADDLDILSNDARRRGIFRDEVVELRRLIKKGR